MNLQSTNVDNIVRFILGEEERFVRLNFDTDCDVALDDIDAVDCIGDDSGTTDCINDENDDSEDEQISGSVDIDIKKAPKIEVLFANGKMGFENSHNNQLVWKCHGANSENVMENEKGLTRLNFKKVANVKCAVDIPKGIYLIVDGGNGKIDFEEPSYHVDLKLANGKIGFSEDTSLKYVYGLRVTNGVVDDFKSNPSSDAYKIDMKIVNGKIDKY